ncbi:hypothetical protein Nepgr_024994 [Nepenthes gracilis]|uniref:Uncharacterized protein n=1 Tax=Nepenthes gracilis TaxID=150966 RepID=A0AAD3T6Y0_NEPGR|nr:hypothetical protein Nepgr_024994 [Nepenthes gracilis]
MSGLSNVGIVLTSLSPLVLLALLAEIVYLFFGRRQAPTDGRLVVDVGFAGDQSSDSPSLELLYFLCWKKRSRIEPAVAQANVPVEESPEVTLDVSEMMKLGGLYGPSRVLSTIKEEEKEEVEPSEASSLGERHREDKAEDRCCGSVDRVTGENSPEVSVPVSLDCFETPSSTPGASPFYTPCPSPSRLES